MCQYCLTRDLSKLKLSMFLWMDWGLRGSVSQSQVPATVHHAGGTTPLKLPGGPTGSDLMNVGHRELPLYVCVCMFETVYTQTAFGVIMRNGPISQSRQWSVKRTHTNT